MKSLSKIFIFALTFAFTACQQDDPDTTPNPTGEVSFSFNVASKSPDEGGRASSVTATELLVTIESTTGNVVYNREPLSLISFNGSFISEPLSLEVGDYSLTEFFVLDESGNAIYVSPLEGSDLAYLVNAPLPISFSVTADGSSQIIPEVLSTAEVTAAQFGYLDFNFSIVETFDFLLSVHTFSEASASYQLTNAHVQISASSNVVYSDSVAAATSQIRIPDGHSQYEIVVTKSAYESASMTVDNSTLKAHLQDPLEIILVATIRNKPYMQDDNGAVYIYMDGGLRHVQKPESYVSLFNKPIYGADFIHFPDSASAPLPILDRWPLVSGTQLMKDTANNYYLRDQYPWDQTNHVLRHINATQLATFGFYPGNAQLITGSTAVGVPMAIESNVNIDAIEHFSGYHAVYAYLIIGATMNPFFNYLLAEFPGHSYGGSNFNAKFKDPIKAKIAYYQAIIEGLTNN